MTTTDILCDIQDCKVLIPNYWWHGLAEMVGWTKFVCGYHRDELMEDGLPAEDFTRGDLIGINHWRPVAA